MLQYFTLFFKKRTRNVLTRKSAGGFAEIFFYRQNPPHPATVLWHCPDFKNNKSYFYPHPNTTLPTPRFFSRKIHTKNRVKKKHYFYLQLIIAWLSRLTRATKTIFILFLQKLLSIPEVFLAVHSSCTSRCPQTILIQERNFVVMTPLIN